MADGGGDTDTGTEATASLQSHTSHTRAQSMRSQAPVAKANSIAIPHPVRGATPIMAAEVHPRPAPNWA